MRRLSTGFLQFFHNAGAFINHSDGVSQQILPIKTLVIHVLSAFFACFCASDPQPRAGYPQDPPPFLAGFPQSWRGYPQISPRIWGGFSTGCTHIRAGFPQEPGLFSTGFPFILTCYPPVRACFSTGSRVVLPLFAAFINIVSQVIHRFRVVIHSRGPGEAGPISGILGDASHANRIEDP